MEKAQQDAEEVLQRVPGSKSKLGFTATPVQAMDWKTLASQTVLCISEEFVYLPKRSQKTLGSCTDIMRSHAPFITFASMVP